MNESLFWLVNVVIVVIATGAPVSNEGNLAPAAAPAENAEDMIMVGKRAEEMVYFGNQQNAPRVPMKKSQIADLHSLLRPPAPVGEEDKGATMVVHDEIPVEKDLNDRAEAVKGESDIERLAEGLSAAEDQVEEAASGGSDVKDKKEGVTDEHVSGEESQESIVPDTLAVDLPESDKNSEEVSSNVVNPVTDMEQDGSKSGDEDEDDNADEELASLSNEASASDEKTDDDGSSNDMEVDDFLDELRKESEDSDNGNAEMGDVNTNSLKGYSEGTENNVYDPNFYETLYRIWSNNWRGAPTDDYYNKLMVPSLMNKIPRIRRHSPFGGAPLASIRSRRNRHVRRIKRDLPSDWLAAYEGLDIPYSSDALLPESDVPYEEDDPINEELSRYIYANLLNKLFRSTVDNEAEEEVPLEEVLPYELGPEVPDSLLEEYEPVDVSYEPDYSNLYRENPYDEYIPSYDYRKRSGAGYYPDSRRKRYFYPAYEEPETHWGAFVPEKRGNYDDAIQRLQRLALALNENPRPYYESLLREYRKK